VTVICEARARLWRRFVVGVPVVLVCGLGLTSSASGQFADSGVKCNGTADDTTTIGRANAAAGAQTVVLSPGICRITSNVTLTAMLHFASGTQFAIERGVTVTIQGELVAPLRRIFSGAGSVIFDNSRVVPVLHPEWWGAVHDGTTDDSRAIQAAVHAVSAGQVIELQTGVYAVGTALSIDRSLTLRGRNRLSSELRWTGARGTLLTITETTSNVRLEEFQFENVGTGTVGIEILGAHVLVQGVRTNPTVKWSTAAIRTNTTSGIFDVTLRDVQVKSSAAGQESAIGVQFAAGNKFTCDGCYLSGNLRGVVVGVPGQVVSDVHVVNSLIETFSGRSRPYPGGATALGIELFRVNSALIAGNHFEICADQNAVCATNKAITLHTVGGAVITGNWFSGSGQATTMISAESNAAKDVVVQGNYAERIAQTGGYLVTVQNAAAGAIIRVGPNGRNATNVTGLLNPANAYTEVPLNYGTSISVDSSQGNVGANTPFVITVTSGTAFTIGSPTHPTKGQMITFRVRNTSGGAMGAVTWAAGYKLAAWTSPANGSSRSITFAYDGASWVEVTRTTADVPN